ncbi:uncharacterized protein [Gossypium hirsutum]|uniref:Retrovirus-related Pol polyprotein from transposon TNT 1-94-like beta-barrel domain-containing protein n=1 Tax=Gossypium hirsutum TaxID=3635 RepID=A0A1U8I4J5_GOSHI|nr:uncharacterized protein LOC107892595 [Gossypium hirsutum]
MAVVNSIRLLDEQFSEARIVEKVLFTLPERYEAKISSLEDSSDLASISLTELINSFYAQEQRRASRVEEYQEGAFQANKRGHVERVCKNKGKPRQIQSQQKNVEARVAEESSDHEEQVFVVSCSANQKKGSKGWLLDSGCNSHMSPDTTIFKTLDRSCKTKVKVGNGQFIKAEGKGDVLICTSTSAKVISNVLLVPKIDRNLLIIAQLFEKGYSVVFKGKECQIADPSGSSLMTVTMKDKCFEVHWPSDSKSAYTASTDDSKLRHQRLGHANFRLMA